MKPIIDPNILDNAPIMRPTDYTCKGNKKQRSCWYQWYFIKGNHMDEVALIVKYAINYNRNILN